MDQRSSPRTDRNSRLMMGITACGDVNLKDIKHVIHSKQLWRLRVGDRGNSEAQGEPFDFHARLASDYFH